VESFGLKIDLFALDVGLIRLDILTDESGLCAPRGGAAQRPFVKMPGKGTSARQSVPVEALATASLSGRLFVIELG
jgi:hypothetical protein